MTDTVIAFISGLVLGGFGGVVIMALCISAKKYDKEV